MHRFCLLCLIVFSCGVLMLVLCVNRTDHLTFFVLYAFVVRFYFFHLRALFNTIQFSFRVRDRLNTEQNQPKNTGKFVDTLAYKMPTGISRRVKKISTNFIPRTNGHDKRTIVHRLQTPRLCPNQNIKIKTKKINRNKRNQKN